MMKHNGLITRYVKLRVAHAPGMPGTLFPPPTSKEIANWRSRHASRHVRHARAVMHVGIAKPRVAGKTFPAFPAHAQPSILCIWQEAHWKLRILWQVQHTLKMTRPYAPVNLVISSSGYGSSLFRRIAIIETNIVLLPIDRLTWTDKGASNETFVLGTCIWNFLMQTVINFCQVSVCEIFMKVIEYYKKIFHEKK